MPLLQRKLICDFVKMLKQKFIRKTRVEQRWYEIKTSNENDTNLNLFMIGIKGNIIPFYSFGQK